MRGSTDGGLVTPLVVGLGLVMLGVTACVEEIPTTVDEDLLPTEPVTIEIELPWAEFGSNLEIFGGYGVPLQTGSGIIANAFAGTLTSRTLVRFVPYPIEVVVTDTLGSTRVEQDISFLGGRVNVKFDTLSSTNGRTPVTVAVGSIHDVWDPVTVTWTNGVDSVGDQRPWPEPGAGPARIVSSADWDPMTGDSVLIELDSAAVADMADRSDPARGVRIDLVSPGERLEINSVQLWLDILPASNPDTIIIDTLPSQALSFVYDPAASVPVDEIRVGGVPAWRTVFDIDLPAEFNGPPELCMAVGCPVVIDPEEVSYAALVLTGMQGDPAFLPADTLAFDVRTVLNRATLPKSPLGPSMTGISDVLAAPDAFGPLPRTPVEMPITPFIRSLLEEVDPGAPPPTNTLALLAALEPVSFSYGSFFGPGSPERPVLRLILTIGPPVELP